MMSISFQLFEVLYPVFAIIQSLYIRKLVAISRCNVTYFHKVGYDLDAKCRSQGQCTETTSFPEGPLNTHRLL